MDRSNLEYVDQLYKSYLNGETALSEEWAYFFKGMEFAIDKRPPSASAATSKDGAWDLKVLKLMDTYRDYGHLIADLDPLSLAKSEHRHRFELERFGLKTADLSKPVSMSDLVGLKQGSTLSELIDRLKQLYCGTMALQVHDAYPEIRDWFQHQFVSLHGKRLSAETQKKILEQLARTESLEKFFHTRFVAQKRFSIEGTDALIPMLETLVEEGVQKEVEEIVIGMAHRGRINVLANFMDKGLDVILAEFTGLGVPDTEIEVNDGDVKYHMGYSSDKKTPSGKSCHVSLAFNPSHLEAVNPVVCGMTRAKQRVRKDTESRKKVIPVQIHGDAAFAGQGVVMETLQLAKVKGYMVGGTIHIILDNQVGFTTSPTDARSSLHSSDTAKILSIPVLHVNADDVEACVKAMSLALSYRQTYKQDCVIRLVGYRKYGHNEGDEPSFTQPIMYKKIKAHPTVWELYRARLDRDRVVPIKVSEEFFETKIANLQSILDEVKSKPPVLKPLAYQGLWSGLRRSKRSDFEKPVDTSTTKENLKTVAKALAELPAGFAVHPKLTKLIESREKMVFESELVDWGMAELLAYGSLILEGNSVRISGQDVVRGTFTHRHCGYTDTETGEVHFPLAKLNPDKEFCAYNSILSEMAVLGFEYGNAIVDPTFLTVWEAQFGDFANGAQIIIDQFIASGESKWQRVCGLVLLLPHGYEGQGPEHSSARLERFLQLCAQDNMQVCNLTTPAQIFHALRRQIKRDFRKPLVIMSPKSLLRHPKVISTLESLSQGYFMELLPDTEISDPSSVETVVLCSGKVYYELLEARGDKQDVALLRVEQLYPFPSHLLKDQLKRFSKLKEVVWCQEEPMNMGAWTFAQPWIRKALDEQNLRTVPVQYVGRTDRSSPATGSPKTHAAEQAEIIQNAIFGKRG